MTSVTLFGVHNTDKQQTIEIIKLILKLKIGKSVATQPFLVLTLAIGTQYAQRYRRY